MEGSLSTKSTTYSDDIIHYFNETFSDTIASIQKSKTLTGKHTSKQKVTDLIKLYELSLPKLSEFISMIIAFVTQSSDASEGVNNVIQYFKSGDDAESFTLDWGAKDVTVKSVQSYLPNHNSMYLFFILYSICNFSNFSHQFPLLHNSGIQTSEYNFWTTLIVRLEEEAIGKMFPISIGKNGKGGDFIYQTLFKHFTDDEIIMSIIVYDVTIGVGYVGNMAAINFIKSILQSKSSDVKKPSKQSRKKSVSPSTGGYFKLYRSKRTKGKTIKRTKCKTIKRTKGKRKMT